jgi:hypothetical protein
MAALLQPLALPQVFQEKKGYPFRFGDKTLRKES